MIGRSGSKKPTVLPRRAMAVVHDLVRRWIVPSQPATDESKSPSQSNVASSHAPAAPKIHSPTNSNEADYKQLCRMRTHYRVPVTEPLVLISQIQRSGGTLLSQLFDGHPQCHAHPSELHTGYPDKTVWPQINLEDDPANWFQMLKESPSERFFQKGYSKYAEGRDAKPELFPFLFPPSLQAKLFQACITERKPTTSRDVWNAYMTSYFNAWLDNHNLYQRPKKYVTAFVPRLTMRDLHTERYFEAYPDGRLISIVREPKSWYSSAKGHHPEYADVKKAMAIWNESTASALRAKRHYPESVYLMDFADLLTDTRGAISRLAAYLDLDVVTSLFEPTFNGYPIKADSTFAVSRHGIITEPLNRADHALTADERDEIDQLSGPTYAIAAAAIATARAAA